MNLLEEKRGYTVNKYIGRGGGEESQRNVEQFEINKTRYNGECMYICNGSKIKRIMCREREDKIVLFSNIYIYKI